VAGFCEHGNELAVSIKEAGYCLPRRVIIIFSKNILHHGVKLTLDDFYQYMWSGHSSDYADSLSMRG